jgi:hypothetical protein
LASSIFKLSKHFPNMFTHRENLNNSFERKVIIHPYNHKTMKNSYKHLLQARQSKGMLSWTQIIATILGIFLLLITASSQAQSKPSPQASLSDKGVLQIPANQTLSESYVFDLSKYKFGSNAEMLEFLSSKSGGDYFVRAQTENKLGILILDLNAHPTWTIVEWNKRLADATKVLPIKP